MRLPAASIGDVIIAYIDEELMPKATKAQKFTTTFMGVALAKQATSILDANIETCKFIGIVNDDGIDIELVRDLALEAFEKAGKVEIFGVVFNKEDVPVLYDIAKRFAKE